MNSLKSPAALAFALMLFAANSAFATVGQSQSGNCSEDAETTANVRELLDGHPALGPPNSIGVQSFNHVVYLNGTVDTGLDKWVAGSVASQAPNVVRVVNSIVESN